MKKYIFTILITLLSFQDTFSQNKLGEDGSFFVGCNYWASNAGTDMWNNWSKEVVEKDFDQLSKLGIKVIRVFPIWSDFQPIVNYYHAGSKMREVRFNAGPLPSTVLGASGIDSVMMNRFRELSDIAKKHDIKLIVGLITGSMSGRLFAPPAIVEKNLINDAVSLMWQCKFIKAFVENMKDHSAILAWDLGNECNYLGTAENREQAYTWTALITNTIRAADNSRQVVSGMAGLSTSKTKPWRIEDQAELTDILTTHPYPYWNIFTNYDRLNTIRSIMYPVAETRMYADIGGKPCMVEETGVMGAMDAGEKVASKYFNSVAFNLWANNCQSIMWWCAYDQDRLTNPPYEWTAVERDLGLFKSDRKPKLVADEIKKFIDFLNNFPYKNLPLRKTDAVCLLTNGNDQWATAYSSYILAKQVGFDIEFQNAFQPLKDSKIYILPSIKGQKVLPKFIWMDLLTKVKKGSILYVSSDAGILAPFLNEAGFIIESTQQRTSKSLINFNGDKFSISASNRYNITLTSSTKIAEEEDGNAAFIVNNYGAGKIYFLTVPLETYITNTAGSFIENGPQYWKFYKEFSEEVMSKKIVKKNNPLLSCTEHYLNDKEAIIVVVNNNEDDIKCKLDISKDWKYVKSFYGKYSYDNTIINSNDALVFLLKKN